MLIRHEHTLALLFPDPLKLVVAQVPPSLGKVIVETTFQGFTVRTEGTEMAYALPDGMKVGVAISYVDSEGNPAKVDGAVHWESSNPAIVDVFVSSDTTTETATIKALSLGTAQVRARADADLGDGVRELVTMFDVEVIAGEAVAGTISPTGEPEDA